MTALECGRWMLDLAKSGLDGAPVGQGGPPVREEASWDELYEISYHHGLIPLVQAGLQVSGLEPPAGVAARLARYSRGSGFRAAQAGDQFREITEEFAKEGIAVIGLKGVLFAFVHYPNPGFRRFKDIDILVRAGDVDSAGAVLDRLGYRSLDAEDSDRPSFFVDAPYKYHCGYERGDEFPVELHWDLVPKRSPVQFDLAGLWERSSPWEGWGPARQMSLEDEIVFLAAHMSRHEFLFPARAFFDLSLLLGQNMPLDADRLWQRAVDCNAALDVAAALGVAARLGLAELSPKLAGRVAETARGFRLSIEQLACYALTWPTFEYADRAVELLAAPSPTAALQRLGSVLFPRYSSLVEREEKKADTPAQADIVPPSYAAMWKKRIGHWARKARNLPAEAANLRTSVRMRRAFSNRTVREEE